MIGRRYCLGLRTPAENQVTVLENHSEASTSPECNDVESDRHILVCPCGSHALQVVLVASMLLNAD